MRINAGETPGPLDHHPNALNQRKARMIFAFFYSSL